MKENKDDSKSELSLQEASNNNTEFSYQDLSQNPTNDLIENYRIAPNNMWSKNMFNQITLLHAFEDISLFLLSYRQPITEITEGEMFLVPFNIFNDETSIKV